MFVPISLALACAATGAHSEIDLQKEPRMTVGELRKKLEGIDPKSKWSSTGRLTTRPPTLTCRALSLRKVLPQGLIAGFTFGGDGSPV
jgi:hypothetical protein